MPGSGLGLGIPAQNDSGTQGNRNVIDVVANLGSMASEGTLGGDRRIPPNDGVNRGPSSNDVFPTAMQVAVALLTSPVPECVFRTT